MMKKKIIASLSLLALALSGCASEAPTPDKLVFAGAPLTPTVEGQPNSFQVLMDLVEEETGLPVEYHESTDRGAIIEGILSGQIDFASIDPYGYVLASAVDKEIEIAGEQVRGADVPPGFTSLAIARSDDESISSLSDLENKKICFSDPASTAGYLYPASALKKIGLEVAASGQGDFSSEFTGIVPFQPAVNVYKGACDVGFIPDSMWFGVMKTLKDLDMSKLKIVWESEKIPPQVIMMSSGIPEDLRDKLTNIIITKANKTFFVESGACTSEQDCNYLNVANWGYIKADKSDYEPVRQTCLSLGIKQCENQ